MYKINRRFSKLYLLIITVFSLGSLLLSWSTSAQGLANGYKTKDTGLKPGMAASLSNESTPDNALVERASIENISRLVGIASEPEDNLVTISSGEQQVYVLSSGEVSAFVSDINGEVKKGDNLTLSPLKGILAKADETTSITGNALEDMPADKAETQTIKTNSGDKSVRVAKMSINIGSNVSTKPATGQANTALSRLGELIVGKKVGDLQVVIALIIFLVVLVTEGSIIYGAVSSGITSIGRNPMAKGIIRKELFKVLGVAIIVLFIGLAAVEAILRI